MKIALDALGGDHAPDVNVDGAIEAARELGISTMLVGQKERIEPLLRARGAAGLPIEIVDASEVIGMDESPVEAVRKKRDSSLRVCARLVKSGSAVAMVSAGNTGATLAAAKLVIGTVAGVDRPALASILPNPRGFAILLDVGANVTVKSTHLREFAVMGHFYSQIILGHENPRIGLMSIGEEEGKGNDLVREAFVVLKETGLNFIGNCEGRDVFGGTVDVIVTDGFTGNVILKVSESLAEMIKGVLKEELVRTPVRKLGALLSRGAFTGLMARLDYSEYGGAPLLGLKGGCIVCHGRSSPKAIKNAIRVARDFVAAGIPEKVAEKIADLHRKEEAYEKTGGEEPSRKMEQPKPA